MTPRSLPAPRTPHRRRTVLAGGALTVGAGLAVTTSGCSFLSTEADGGGGGGTGEGTDTMESPMLTELVDAGELPPLEERLPAEPLVVSGAEPGVHGGTWRALTLGPGDNASVDRIVGYEPPRRYDPMLGEVGPGVFADVVANEDATEFTLTLREGMKWSDGEPFTADDVVFAVEDVLGNAELFTSPPAWISSDGVKATATAPDELTAVITFPATKGLFLDELTRNMELINYPRHYAQDFLATFNDDIDQKVSDAGLETWTDLWNDQIADQGPWKNVDLPSIDPWIVTVPLGAGSTVDLERNPYYWKTDDRGRQLPYIDRLSFEVVSDPEVMVLKVSDGEVDLMFRHANSSANKPVYAENAESAGITVMDNTPTSMNTMCIALNLAHKDPDKASLYQDRDFRIGLSHAINREELITAVWQRQGEPWQWAPHRESMYFDEEFATQYTAFDTDLAEEHLDAAGVTGRDGDGMRTMPNGDTLVITLDVPSALSPEWPVAASIISEMWAAVGVRMSVNTVDRTLFYDRKVPSANEIDAGVWTGDGGLAIEDIDPRWYMAFSDESVWASAWSQYYTSGGTAGIEPIPPVLEQMELMWQYASTADADEREGIFRQVLAIAKEEFWGIGIGTLPNPYWVVRNRVRNVIGGVPDTWVYRTPGHTNPETWFLTEDA